MPRPELSFHTSGRRHPHNGSHIIVDQAYVQYIPPVLSHPSSFPTSFSPTTTSTSQVPVHTSEDPLPVLFIHGGGLTGSMWESTPDGRPGWAVLASRGLPSDQPSNHSSSAAQPTHRPPAARPVYILDAVSSGRSQLPLPALRPEGDELEHRTAAEMWARFRFGPVGSFDAERGVGQPFVDSAFPIEAYDALVAGQAARRRGAEQYEAEVRGVKEAVRRIGECVVVAHSNGAAVAHAALMPGLRSEGEVGAKGGIGGLVRRFVMVEPGPPFREEVLHLGSGEGGGGEEGKGKVLMVWGDYIPESEVWKGSIKRWRRLVVPDAEQLMLPDVGIRGNSHFPLADRNSAEVWRKIVEWLDR